MGIVVEFSTQMFVLKVKLAEIISATTSYLCVVFPGLLMLGEGHITPHTRSIWTLPYPELFLS